MIHNEAQALEIIYGLINKYRSRVSKSIFLRIVYRLKGLDARMCFLADTEEYWMIRDACGIVYENGLPHDINTSKEYPILHKLYVNLKKEILEVDGMKEYLAPIVEQRRLEQEERTRQHNIKRMAEEMSK